MAIWFILITITLNVQAASVVEVDKECTKHASQLGGQQITCANVTSKFFENFTVPLNRSHWLTCTNCTMRTLDERTFNFTRNNISLLFLADAKIKTLKRHVFVRMPGLKVLILKENCIDSIDQKAFSGIKKLTQLDLSGNNLRILVNNLFTDLENLDILSLNRNNIFYMQPDAFVGLKNLKYLYLSNNGLNKLEEKTFKYLPNLRILYLENNCIYEIHYLAFYNLSRLNYLYLNNNSINYLVQFNFKPLSSLINLQLRYNNLTEIQTSSFNGLKNIKFLYLGDNHLTSIKPYGFIGLESLEYLEMNNNDFETMNYSELCDMKNLKVLWMENNSISNFQIDYKSEVQNSLVVLGLGFNNFSFLNYKLLYNKMPNVKDIYVNDNAWKCEAFVNMYNFFDSNNVSLCSYSTCDSNSTKSYIDSLCHTVDSDDLDDDDFPTDFSTDSSNKIETSIIVYSAILIFFVEII
ncbi:insulin-like growth factor-binding protein complex acid labile subunit [Aethina tumida]|uniref:insulin-like growth factor-binding protein complex acid labile subunit n=1 Tax=Aethina tumida TaxID=116153 RepID=UPI00096B65EE|nr:insulin-like growth factor-binding protein complex acid labile subunit [Aethina tumida]